MEKLKGSRKMEGMFTLYQDTLTGSVLMYVNKKQLDKEFIYQSFSMVLLCAFVASRTCTGCLAYEKFENYIVRQL